MQTEHGYAIGARTVHLTVCTSTNDEARELARQGEPEGTVVVSDQQTAGRGRRGRGWHSPPGVGLYASIVLRPRLPPEAVSGLGLASALAVARALQRLCNVGARVKWPNDVMIGNRKVAGVLAEAGLDEQGAAFAVIGIGVNINQPEGDFPQDVRPRATSVRAAAGTPVKRALVLKCVCEEMDSLYHAYQAGGFTAIRGEYLSLCETVGHEVRVESPQGQWEGIAEDVDDAGRLLVRDAGGELRVMVAGDVSVRRTEGSHR